MGSHRLTFWAHVYPAGLQADCPETSSTEVPSSSPRKAAGLVVASQRQRVENAASTCVLSSLLCAVETLPPTLYSFPDLKKRSCRASVYFEREQLPTQGLCLISRTGTVTKASREKGKFDPSSGLPQPLQDLGSSRSYQFCSKQVLGWRALVSGLKAIKVPPRGTPRALW